MITEHLPALNWTIKTTPEGWTHCFDDEGVQRCGVRRPNGKPCLNTKGLYDTGRCHHHQRGAANKRGYEHPRTTTGLTSQYLDHLPKRLNERYQNALKSEKLLELNENVALMDVMIQDLLPRLYSGDLGQLWLDLKDTFDEAESNWRLALSGNNPIAMREFQMAFKQLGQFIRSGRQDWITRQEIMKISDNKRSLVKTVSDVEYKGENAITMADFLQLLEYMEGLFFRINKLENEQERQQAYADGLRKVIYMEDVS